MVPGPEDTARYVDLVCAEAALWGRRLGRARVSSLYVGGGTPSLLSPPALGRIFSAVHKAFAPDADLECTLEGNPDSLAAFGYLHELRRLGVNRLSVGVQSTYDHYLQVLGRAHDAATAKAVCRMARDAGLNNLSIDLIWGLPKQRLYTWMQQLREIMELAPCHLSCYGLSLDEGTPLARAAKRQDLGIAPDDDLAKMYVYGAEFLESEGLLHYEISNFARMGFTSRHNLGYWEGRDYLGLGPSAFSTLRRRRWGNPADLEEWAAQVRAGTIGREAEQLDLETRVRELIMLRLRTSRGLRLRAYSQLTGSSFVKDFNSMVQALRQNGLIRISQGYLRLTKNGMLVSDSHLLANLFVGPGPSGPASRNPSRRQGHWAASPSLSFHRIRFGATVSPTLSQEVTMPRIVLFWASLACIVSGLFLVTAPCPAADRSVDRDRRPGGPGHRQRGLRGRAPGQPGPRRSGHGRRPAQGGVHGHPPGKRRPAGHGAGHPRLRGHARPGHRGAVLLRGPRHAGGRHQLPPPTVGADIHRQFDVIVRGRGRRPRPLDEMHARGQRPEHRHPGRLPRQPLCPFLPAREAEGPGPHGRPHGLGSSSPIPPPPGPRRPTAGGATASTPGTCWSTCSPPAWPWRKC